MSRRWFNFLGECRANDLTGFYMKGVLAFNELIITLAS